MMSGYVGPARSIVPLYCTILQIDSSVHELLILNLWLSALDFVDTTVHNPAIQCIIEQADS